MKSLLRPIRARATAGFASISALSRPTRLFIGAELTAGLLAAGVAWTWVTARLDALVTLDELPPWALLAAFPAVGALCSAWRALRPDQVVRRWHGVLIRRIDERFA